MLLLRAKNPQRQPLAVAGFSVRHWTRNRGTAKALLFGAAAASMAASDAPKTNKAGWFVMVDRSFEKVARDLSSDFAALRDDLRKLTNVVSDLASDSAENTRSGFSGVVDRARDRFSGTADRVAGHATSATDRVRGAGVELESRIEKNPLTAVMIAIVGGLLIGALSRSRR